MYAIVAMAGQQFKVAKDQKVYVHRLKTEAGQKVTFDQVLLLDDGKRVTLGAPVIEGTAVEARVVQHLKGDKVIVFKKKRRKGYRKKNGHRQYLTEIVVENIVAKGAPKATPAKAGEQQPEAPQKVAASKAEKPKKATTQETEDPSTKTVAELREMAKAKGITGYSSMKKAELIEALKK